MPGRFARLTGKGTGPLVVAMLVSGCATAPSDRPAPDITLPANFSASGSEVVGTSWWREFRDRNLNSLQGRALAGNFSLQSSWQRLRQAEAIVSRARSDLGPEVDAGVGGTLFETSGDHGVLGLNLGASYELDLWGKINSRAEAAAYRARATREDYHAAALSLTSEVARTWFQLVEARQQVALVRGQIETNDKVVSSLEGRFVQGQSRAVDVLRQRQLLEATREQLTLAELQEEVLANELVVLLGCAPGAASVPGGGSLPELPPLPHTGLPLRLLENRPDVRAAFARIQAADQEVAAALAERLPRVTLTAFSGGSGNSPSAIFSDWVSGVGFDLLGPVIDSGERAAEVERTRAVLAEQFAEYGRTVVEAIGEVENALVRERKQKERIARLEEQVELAERSSRQLRRGYVNGASDFIEVLSALDGEQQLRRDLLAARRQLLEYRIALYRALGGGTAGSKG